LIVASDVWYSARELPACHWLSVAIKLSSSRSVVIVVVNFVIISALTIMYAMLSASIAVILFLQPEGATLVAQLDLTSNVATLLTFVSWCRGLGIGGFCQLVFSSHFLGDYEALNFNKK